MDIVQEFIARPDSFMKALGSRSKRETSTTPKGFRVFPLPFIGAEVGVKYSDAPQPTGEAYLHIDDLQSLIPQAQSKMVKLRAKFGSNGILNPNLAIFNFEVNYQLEHKTGHGTEEGSFKVTREEVADPKNPRGIWKFNIKSETVPFVPLPLLTPFSPIIPLSISNVEFEVLGSSVSNVQRFEKSFSGKLVNSETGRDIRWQIKVMSDYNAEVEHIDGEKNSVADFLSI